MFLISLISIKINLPNDIPFIDTVTSFPAGPLKILPEPFSMSLTFGVLEVNEKYSPTDVKFKFALTGKYPEHFVFTSL